MSITFDSLLAPYPETDTFRIGTSRDRVIHLWSLLPSELASLYRPRVPDMAAEVLQEINRSIPDYAQTLDGSYGRTLAHGIQHAIEHFLDRLADPTGPQKDREALFRNLGRHELQEGRNLDLLQAAYRIGARVSWRRMAQLGEQANIPISTLCLLAEAIFAYMDELSALSIEGFASAQARQAGANEVRRRRLLKLLLAEPPSGPALIASAARSAGWALPERVIPIALEARDSRRHPSVPEVAANILVDLESNNPCLLVSEADEHQLSGLNAGMRGWWAAVGPKVRLRDAPKSLRWAQKTLGLVHRGLIEDKPVTWCTERLTTLWLFSDTSLANELAARALRPLAELSSTQRTRLSETLLAWLKTRGNVAEVAQSLDVHPQTVRNRLHQLEGLFGDRMNDPNDRFEMEVALRALQGLGGSDIIEPLIAEPVVAAEAG
ncbi:MAG TPA: helix-turn-helix domain-containing protein [Pseudonocardiaceae bacterium]|jgi:hypothetical protein|nr:helix-turn-helix domain-containing protein [Pseudonocardiaceae bacterium]